MNFFDVNIKELETQGAHFLGLDGTIYGESLTYVATDEQGVKWFWNDKHIPVSVTNDVDKNAIPNKNLKQIIFFFGLASIEEIRSVYRCAHPESLFIIIEPNFSLLQYALNYEDLRYLNGINYMIAAVDSSKIFEVIETLTASKILLLLKNPVFYLNSYYRQHELDIIKEYIVQIRNSLKHKFFKIGNSIDDSLIGLVHNMQNLKIMSKAPDAAALKNCFRGYPAFVVSAGPSLDKNIDYLKKIGNKGIIIAVDTIAEKLVKNGIKPHFIGSVERFNVWEYFFENKHDYYRDSYIVGPPVLQPKVCEAFDGRVILPMRDSVREYMWLSEILGFSEDHVIWMGGSCAHVALGLAMHFGADPIVLVGQDLAYGDDITQTHAAGTEYDIKPEEEPEEVLFAEGYYGGEVKTQSIWQDFRILFEARIKNTSAQVINSTEGGARIKGTLQRPLKDVVAQYCIQEIDFGLISNIPKTNLDWVGIGKKLVEYVEQMEKDSEESLKQLRKLQDIRDRWDYYVQKKGIKYIFSVFSNTEKYFQSIPKNQLLYHNLQGPLVIIMQKFHLIAEDGNLESVKQNLLLQIEFCEMYTQTVWLIAQVIQENFPWDEAKKGEVESGV